MKTNKLLLYSCLSITLFGSCKKFLNKNPDNRTQINTIDKLKQLVGTAYPQADYLTFAETASDNAEDKGSGDINDYLTAYYFWNDYPNNDANTAISYWNGCYTAIAAANQALESIKENNFGADADPYKGEALVCRAYAEHMLSIFFAKPYVNGGDNSSPGVPYPVTPETTLLGKYTRGTVQSTYDSIEADLTEGMKLLSANAYDVPKYHFTPAAAHAFAARFYLFKGEWQKVIDQVAQIIPSGDIKDNLRQWTSVFKPLSPQDFNNAFTKTDVKATLLMNSSYSTYQRVYTTPEYGYGSTLSNMFLSGGNCIGKALDNKVFNYGLPNYTTYKWKEYFYYATANTGYPYLPMILFTVDEALLNRAEAYAQLGQFDLALQDLNTFYSVRMSYYNPINDAVTFSKIMAYYSISDEKEGVIRAILDAKKAEFLQEGLRWLDIVRTGITVRHNVIDSRGVETFIELKPDDPRRLFQLPEEAKLAGLELNPR
ncbi:hypothetical protein A9P82_05580 [Arachidicoccus ginsenosidimutans]|uniref:RagB/SusD family nutrient uptake outer membrane protein n=1 Tax=Arachidicoccus sp. BS20 TaxID=1850526 RepID=UPI0007F10815|nr:RagB/SusD family nutrient uptake outer membrane protein [Arachidicoccus sp. BS20]ANI88804.1 hypothetical protein A9P82_05580 [Arachidicoccus sp. BS20]